MNWFIFNLMFFASILMLCISGAVELHCNYYLKWWQVGLMWVSIALGFSVWLGWLTA